MVETGEHYRVIKRDTETLDYSSHELPLHLKPQARKSLINSVIGNFPSQTSIPQLYVHRKALEFRV